MQNDISKRIDRANSTLKEVTAKLWVLSDVIVQIVDTSSAPITFSPIKGLSTSRFFKYYNIAKTFSLKERKLGLDFAYYEYLYDKPTPHAFLEDACKYGWSIDDLKRTVRGSSDYIPSIGSVKIKSTILDKIKFRNENKNSFVSVLKTDNGVYARMGSVLLSRPDVGEVYLKMGEYN
jgi:hypothetical protein